MSASAPFIIVTGNIAAGKSTLINRLTGELGLRSHLERVEDNPFFGTPSQRSLESETWFLVDSVMAHREIERSGQGGLQERSAYEHVPVFAQARRRRGWLDADEFALLRTLADLLTDGLKPPDLLVYLEADVQDLTARIAQRARPGEQLLDPAYLAALDELYDELVDGWRLSPVYRLDTTRVDVREEDGLRIACLGVERTLPSAT
ncbi:MAG TPA: deoxynucleoside kinase [Solirubrobacteraceae bacterium]